MDTLLTFETERLFLRPMDLTDTAFIRELLNSPKWLRNIGNRNISDEAAAVDYVKTRVDPQFGRLGYGNYTVVRKADGERLGTCGLYDREGLDGIDIGFAFLPRYEGMGYAYEAASRIQRAAVESFGLTQLGAITLEANLASRKLLEKLCFRFVRTMRIPDDDEELMYYEWRNQSADSVS